ncbi:MAG: HD domain-containing protein [Spirochaetaceae bacterium]|nr:HD domain-containing protein [Spirochaetaceae bacterium]
MTDPFGAYPAEERERIDRALAWANNLEGKRKFGIARILAELNLDSGAIVAAIVQQSVETDGDRRDSVESLFGAEAAFLAEGAGRIADISAANRTLQEAENIRKMLFAMVSDIRVIFIRLAERLYHMRELGDPDAADNHERRAAAQECLSIYAPLADRLGISWMKDELEDLALKHLYRDAFNQIKEMVSLKRGQRQNYLDQVTEILRAEAAAAGIDVEVSSRAKHFYSIYQKMRRRNKGAGELLDLFGIRIICDSMEGCYTLLGLVHRLWKPLEGRFKDYIAMPKSNGYQSLHTTVMVSFGGPSEDSGGGDDSIVIGEPFPWSPLGPGGGQPMEIQIRTREMHQVAEHGVASHWLYKKGAGAPPGDVGLVNRLRTWKLFQGETENSEAFLNDIKRELLKDSIFVFTPQGKIIELPRGATAIDFAYAIHSAIGDHCSAAKANGSIIPLGAELKNTQVVEILTATNARPHLNWLRSVKTSKARSKIRAWLQQNDSSQAAEKSAAAKKKETRPPESPPQEKPAESAPPEPVQRVSPPGTAEAGLLQVRVQPAQGPAEKNMLFHFAQCCKPVPGDPIVGYVSRGRGIIIHRKNCRNLAHIPDFSERRIETEWEASVSRLVRHFKVEARLQADLFSEIEGAMRKYQGRLLEGRLEETSSNHMTGFFTMRLNQEGDLQGVMKSIRAIPAVYSIVTADL